MGLEGAIVGDVSLVQRLQRYSTWCCYTIQHCHTTLKQLDIFVGCWRCVCWGSRHPSIITAHQNVAPVRYLMSMCCRGSSSLLPVSLFTASVACITALMQWRWCRLVVWLRWEHALRIVLSLGLAKSFAALCCAVNASLLASAVNTRPPAPSGANVGGASTSSHHGPPS